MRDPALLTALMSPCSEPERVDAASADETFLHTIGHRLRLIRAQRGMARRVLAEQSGISERYIAQFEAGSGNMSLLLLRRLARALGVPVEELIAERPDRRLDLVLLEQFLARLTDAQVGEARQLLAQRFAPGEADARLGRIALIGMRGAGKSSLGCLLAEARGAPFVELDQEVEQASRMALRDIFELHGQEAFRRLEREALGRVLARGPAVIATGGGLVTEPATLELLLASCLTVWVRTSPEEHMRRVVEQGDERPMADNQRAMDDLRAILASREPLYRQADLVLDTSGAALEASLAELIERLPAASLAAGNGIGRVALPPWSGPPSMPLGTGSRMPGQERGVTNPSDIREHMEVIGADSGHIGTVDKVESERIKLTRDDRNAGGVHYWLPVGMVDGVEGDKVRMSFVAELAPQFWEGEGSAA